MSRGMKIAILSVFLCALGAFIVLVTYDRLHPTIDKNGDGKPDEWFTYNLKGELVELKRDRNHDGKVDHIEFHKDGKISILMVDMNNDGIFEAIQRFDAEGNMLTLERDTNGDGKIDRIRYYDPVTHLQIMKDGLQ